MNILFTYVDLECAFGTNPYNTATDKIDQGIIIQSTKVPNYQSGLAFNSDDFIAGARNGL